MFRRFRDNWLMSQDDGASLIAEYYSTDDENDPHYQYSTDYTLLAPALV